MFVSWTHTDSIEAVSIEKKKSRGKFQIIVTSLLIRSLFQQHGGGYAFAVVTLRICCNYSDLVEFSVLPLEQISTMQECFNELFWQSKLSLITRDRSPEELDFMQVNCLAEP